MTNNEFLGYLTSETWADANFAPVRDSEALAKLPPDARAEWTQFWNELPKMGPREVAPSPREVVDIQKSVD